MNVSHMTPTQRLIELLEAEGLSDIVVYPNRGPRHYSDILCWHGYANVNGVRRTIGSWDRITECVRNGIVCDLHADEEVYVMVNAKTRDAFEEDNP